MLAVLLGQKMLLLLGHAALLEAAGSALFPLVVGQALTPSVAGLELDHSRLQCQLNYAASGSFPLLTKKRASRVSAHRIKFTNILQVASFHLRVCHGGHKPKNPVPSRAARERRQCCGRCRAWNSPCGTSLQYGRPTCCICLTSVDPGPAGTHSPIGCPAPMRSTLSVWRGACTTAHAVPSPRTIPIGLLNKTISLLPRLRLIWT